MARADSTVRVNIIGDAKSLQKATLQAEGAFGGIGKQALKVGAIVGGAFAVDAVTDFAQTALGEADRVGDAITELEVTLGDLAQPIIDAADEFSHLGASEGDMLELANRITELGTASGLTKDQIAGLAIDAGEAATALSLLGDEDAATILEQIGKAGDGSARALLALGINVTEAEVEIRALADTGKASADALTESELAAARYELVLEALDPKVKAVTDGTADLEQKQKALEAKFETLTGKIGEAIEGPLSDLLSFTLSGIEGFELLATKLDAAGVSFGVVTTAIKAMLAPILLVSDAVGALIDQLNRLRVFGDIPGAGGFKGRINAGGESKVNINVQGGSPEAIEQAVRDAVYRASRHG
jgi:hypothetical protein